MIYWPLQHIDQEREVCKMKKKHERHLSFANDDIQPYVIYVYSPVHSINWRFFLTRFHYRCEFLVGERRFFIFRKTCFFFAYQRIEKRTTRGNICLRMSHNCIFLLLVFRPPTRLPRLISFLKNNKSSLVFLSSHFRWTFIFVVVFEVDDRM